MLRYIGHERVIVDLLLLQKRVANMDHLPELAAAGALSVDTDITLIDGDHSSRLVDVILIAQEAAGRVLLRSEEHTSELQSLMRISYAVFCLKKKKTHNNTNDN